MQNIIIIEEKKKKKKKQKKKKKKKKSKKKKKTKKKYLSYILGTPFAYCECIMIHAQETIILT